MESAAQQPEPSQATAYLDIDGNVTCGVPENCEIKRRTSFSHKRIGVCVLIFDPKRGFVVGKRKGSHGAGELRRETMSVCIVQLLQTWIFLLPISNTITCPSREMGDTGRTHGIGRNASAVCNPRGDGGD